MVLRKVLFIWSSMPIFSFIGYAPWRSYLENLTIGNKFINKRVQLCIHCYVSRRKNYQYVITRLQNISLIVLKKKNTEGATRGAEAVTRGALQEKVFLKILQTSQENNCVGVLFYEIASLQPASLLKIDSNKMLSCEVSETSKNTYFEEHLQATASRGVL